MKDLYPILPPFKVVSTEEKAEFVKKNRKNLILPVDGVLSEDKIDEMVYYIKNEWQTGGIECSIMLDDMYDVLIKSQG